ncbi:peptidase inhibitor family I36 protein [Amycolatopsis sp. A133]|uniref:peptidase inhibitor family I36 protein n=1 Tax=Amycolatopsis sp. A133 TaxID=3064472 RepID=UPI0027F877F2|nr:peptidase inhibitor family I36 protein [Amycolatopsis sp. A133]MDQ7802477.1 peptidase inhibitor family I36 protein [Amycolatopsis sp. A133]
MRRTFTRLSLTLSGAAMLAGAVVPTASAGTLSPLHVDSLGDCPSGRVCMWTAGNFAYAPTAYPAVSFRSLNPGDHDGVSSWANKTSYQYCLYDNGNTILLDTLAPGRSRGTMPAGTNDRADAYGRC